MQINNDLEKLQIHIERSKRKTLSMSVNKDGSVAVKAPLRYPSDKEIQEFVAQKMDWIKKQRKRQQECEEQHQITHRYL